MVNGFERETHELNEYELTIVPIIVKKIRNNNGEKMAVKNKEIIRYLHSHGFKKVGAARIRKLIHHIRVKKLVINLIATSKGYYRAKSQEELDKFIQSLQQRINSIEEVKQSFIQ